MKENEIRRREALDRYQQLVAEDCRLLFGDGDQLIQVNCPACHSQTYVPEFTKSGFEYVTCGECQTLFARTRPSLANLKQFYIQSAATEYWVNEFFKPVAEVRREKIFRPRAQFIVDHFGSSREWLVGDVGAGFGLFLDELRKLWPASRYIAIEPSPEQADICKGFGFAVECCILEDLKGYEGCFNLLTAFELLEHLYDPSFFLKAAYRLLKPGGWLLLSTLNGKGFDIQVLWEKSKSIYPPCHINFFNPDSLSILLRSAGLAVEELATPGKLDWDIVEGMILETDVEVGRFWRLLARKGNEGCKKDLQRWISEHKFSSHMRALARKAGSIEKQEQ
jgi:SAM-dependent methyltransferase